MIYSKFFGLKWSNYTVIKIFPKISRKKIWKKNCFQIFRLVGKKFFFQIFLFFPKKFWNKFFLNFSIRKILFFYDEKIFFPKISSKFFDFLFLWIMKCKRHKFYIFSQIFSNFLFFFTLNLIYPKNFFLIFIF